MKRPDAPPDTDADGPIWFWPAFVVGLIFWAVFAYVVIDLATR